MCVREQRSVGQEMRLLSVRKPRLRACVAGQARSQDFLSTRAVPKAQRAYIQGGGVVTKFSWAHRPSVFVAPVAAGQCVTGGGGKVNLGHPTFIIHVIFINHFFSRPSTADGVQGHNFFPAEQNYFIFYLSK